MQLDTSQVNRGMLHMNDPVNTGVPSELHIAVDWLDLLPPGPLAEMPLPASEEGDPAGLLLVELHGGAGFHEDAALDPKRGLFWRCRLERDSHLPVLSSKGKYYQEEPEFNLTLNRILFDVVDRLVERGLPVPEIANIVSASPEEVLLYLRAKEELQRKAEERRQSPAEDRCVDLRWHQTIPLLVRQPMEACLALDLIEGPDLVVGHLDPLPLQQLLMEGGCMPRAPFRLHRAAAPSSARDRLTGAWLFPSCAKPVISKGGRYQAVQMELSVRFQLLVRGDLPKTAGGFPPRATSVGSA